MYYSIHRIIESVEEITSNADLFSGKTLRIVKSFLATEIWDQDGDGTIIIGLQLHQEGDTSINTINATDLLTVEQPDETDVNITDTAIYLDEQLLTGSNSFLHDWLIYWFIYWFIKVQPCPHKNNLQQAILKTST